MRVKNEPATMNFSDDTTSNILPNEFITTFNERIVLIEPNTDYINLYARLYHLDGSSR